MAITRNALAQRLAKAFKQLASDGMLAERDFMCCQGCGTSSLWQRYTKAPKGQKPKSYVFWHSQDNDDRLKGMTFYLSFGVFRGKGSVRVGQQVVKALTAASVKTEWDGTAAHRIIVCAGGAGVGVQYRVTIAVDWLDDEVGCVDTSEATRKVVFSEPPDDQAKELGTLVANVLDSIDVARRTLTLAHAVNEWSESHDVDLHCPLQGGKDVADAELAFNAAAKTLVRAYMQFDCLNNGKKDPDAHNNN